MKSNPQHRRQVNKQALKDETKEAARKQFCCSVVHWEREFLLPLPLLLPTWPAGSCVAHNLGSVGLKHNLKIKTDGSSLGTATSPFF